MTNVISDADFDDLIGDLYNGVGVSPAEAPQPEPVQARGKFYRRERVDFEAFRIVVDNARAIFDAPAPRG